jgi:hypothetical protein
MGFTLPSKSTENAVVPSKSDESAVVVLRGVPVPLNSDIGGAFISDASRNRERLLSDQRIIEKWQLTMADWTEIAKISAFRLAVDAEHERRVMAGDCARESAAQLFAEAPHTIAEILNDKRANARHRIDAYAQLRTTASAGTEKANNDADRFIISINLSADEKIKIDKQIKPLTATEAKEALDAE